MVRRWGLGTARQGLSLVLLVLALACSPPPDSQPSGSRAATPPAAPPPSGTAPADCGPPVADEADNVRVAVLEDLISRATSDAQQRQVSLGLIVLAEEERRPGGAIFVHDVAPEFLERFAGRSPLVANYSSAFTVQDGRTVRTEAPVAFVTGAICWTSPSRALVDARRLASAANHPYRATVEQRDGAWQVTSLADRR